MRIYLFNNTSSEHAGCQAVMESLRAVLQDHEIIATHQVGEIHYDFSAMQRCDAVLVNGEGTLHHGNGVFLMQMLALGQALGKKTLLVNALFQQEPLFFQEILRGLDFFSVREPRSLECARRCGAEPELRLDSCVGAATEPGRVGAPLDLIVKGDTHPASPVHGLLEALPLPYFGLRDISWAGFLAALRTCRVYVTGQHHAVYACGLAGVPFVALPGNSHKIEALLEWSGLPIQVATSLAEVKEQIAFAAGHPEVYLLFQEFLRSQKAFDPEDLDRVLGTARAPHMLRCYDEQPGRKLIGATAFFRNRELFRTVLEEVDPARDEIHVLFHSASVGCEPYSFCIAYERFFQGRPHPRLHAWATDLSGEFLGRAPAGVYPAEVLDNLHPEERAYFEPWPDGQVRVREYPRGAVQFLDPASFVDFQPPRTYDLVFLLNSLLYVPAEDQARALDRIAGYNSGLGLLVTTGTHADRLQTDLARNHYVPVLKNYERIYKGWVCRKDLPPGFLLDGITHYSPALEPIHPCPDWEYRFCSIFRKE